MVEDSGFYSSAMQLSATAAELRSISWIMVGDVLFCSGKLIVVSHSRLDEDEPKPGRSLE